MTDFALQIKGWRLTTAKILYHIPDHPSLLQTYVWQDLDLMPDLPMLKRFLAFWQRRLDGKLHSVTVASVPLVQPAEVRMVGHLMSLGNPPSLH